jgi:hypothetical protein
MSNRDVYDDARMRIGIFKVTFGIHRNNTRCDTDIGKQ